MPDPEQNVELTEQEKRAAWRMAEAVLDHVGLTRNQVIRFIRRREMPCPHCGRAPINAKPACKRGRPRKNIGTDPDTVSGSPLSPPCPQ